MPESELVRLLDTHHGTCKGGYCLDDEAWDEACARVGAAEAVAKAYIAHYDCVDDKEFLKDEVDVIQLQTRVNELDLAQREYRRLVEEGKNA